MDVHLDAWERQTIEVELAKLNVRQPAQTRLGEQASRFQ